MPRAVFLISALLPAAAAPLHVARATSAHPGRIASGGCSGTHASWRANPTLEMPANACHGVIDAYAVPPEEHPFTEECERAPAGSDLERDPKIMATEMVEGDFIFVASDEIF